MDIVPTRQSVLSDLQFKLQVIPLHPHTPEMPSQLSLFYATSLEISQIARWCRASPENTLSDLPIVSDPKDFALKDDGMALCVYDDTMKVWSTVPDWAPQWGEVGQRITDAIQKNPTIQSSWDGDINHLNMGHESLKNFREHMWVDDNGSVRPVSSPFMLGNSLEEEVKRLEAEFINLPCDEDEEEVQLPYSPLSNLSDPATTPPLSPCSQFGSPESLSSLCFLPGSPLRSLTSPLFLNAHRTISPYEIFSPLPLVEEDLADDVPMGEAPEPPTPVVSTRPLPETECAASTSFPFPNPPLSRSPSPPAAGSSSSPLKRSRWLEDESGDESDEFVPQARKKTRAGKRSMACPTKRAKLEGRGTRCDLCGMCLGRITDLPRHKASCKSNPERATRQTPCEICGKLLPVRPDAVKRHLGSKTCRSKRKKGEDKDPYLSDS